MARRVLLGKEGSNYVLKISKPGVDVIDDTIASRDYLFNSEVYRAGVLRANTTVNNMDESGENLETTSDSSGTPYIPAYIITEKGLINPTGIFDQTDVYSNSGFEALYAKAINCLSTKSGGGMFEFSLASSGTTKNIVKAVYVNFAEMQDPRPGETTGYPYIESRTRLSSDGDVNLQVMGIPCQFGKMTNSATLFGNSVLSEANEDIVVTGGSGSTGATAAAGAITGFTRTARNPSVDSITVSASNGANNTATKFYGVNTSNTAVGVTFGASANFTQPRGSIRYYFVKQNNLISTTTGTTHVYGAAAVDTTPDAFTFTVKNNATAGQNFSQASSAIAGLADGDSATVSVSGGTVTPSSVVNGGTVTATGTAASAGGSTTVTVTIGGVPGTFVINTAGVVPDTQPNAFGDFTPDTGNEINTVSTSNSITIQGINQAIPVTISGNGTFSIAGGSYGTSGNVSNQQSISVRLTSPGTLGQSTNTTLTVGSGSNARSGIFVVSNRSVVAASQPTGLTLTQTTNSSGSGQTVTATGSHGSGGAGTIQVSNDGTNFQSNGHGFTQNRSGSATTYYTRAVTSDQTSGSLTATKLVPPVVTLSGIGTFSENSSSKNASYHVNDQRAGGNFNTYSSYWGTVNTSISNNSGGWLSSSITNSAAGTFNLTTAANTTTSSQSATVTYTTTTQFGHTHTMTFTYTQAGIPIDTDPDQFTFSDVSTDDLNTDKFANDQITGINTATNATYSGDANGSFSVTGISGTYNQSAKSVSNGTQIHVKLTSSPNNSTARSATITVGTKQDTFTVTTSPASDSNPDQFTFTDVTGAASTTVFTSTITLAGMNTSATATMSSTAVQAQFKVNNGSFGTGSQTVSVGNTITAQVRSATGSFQAQSITITVGDKSDTFTVLTGNTGGSGGIE
jgi:hypothetical protein